MSTQETYTPQEWAQIMQAPAMAGMVVMLAGRSGPLQLAKEVFSVGRLMADIDRQGNPNELIRSVVAAAKDRNVPQPETQPERPENVEAARQQALDHCRAVAALLDARTTPEEARGFKEWLVTIASTVAAAAKEGGFLGIGGTQVIEEEQQAIATLSQALGVSGAATGPTMRLPETEGGQRY